MANNKKAITINGISYLLTFGLDFASRMNDLYSQNLEGVSVGFGLPKAFVMLGMHDAVVIRDIIRCAVATNHNQPTDEEIEEWIYEQMETEETEKQLFDDFFEYLQLVPGARKFGNSINQSVRELNEAQSKTTKKNTK